MHRHDMKKQPVTSITTLLRRRLMNHRLILNLFVILLVTSTKFVFADFPNVRVSRLGSHDPEEVTISINPTNPLNVAAGANINYYYYSFDGGKSWSEGRLQSKLGVYGDPSVVFDAEGDLFFGHLSNPLDGAWLDRIVVQKSSNGGKNWDSGVGVGLNPPKHQDKEWLAVDLTNSRYRNRKYMAWTEFDRYGSSNPNDSTRILFSCCDNSSWSKPIRISDKGGNCIDNDETVEGAVPAVGPNGEVYISWSGPLGIMFDKSLDGGKTFGTDIFVTDQPGGWAFQIPGISRCNGMPVTACDISDSPYNGTIYVMWSDQRNGIHNTDVFLIKSTDGGKTWAERKRVNDDNSKRHQFFPWMAIDPFTGYIYIVFYDRRNTTENETEVYVAKSTDGGETFQNFKVSETAFTPVKNIFFGDYTNIAAYNGMVYPIWMRMDNSNLSIWTAIIADTATGVEPIKISQIDDFSLSQNYPNPFNMCTKIKFSLQKVSYVRIDIFDMQGRYVRELINKKYGSGEFEIDWDGMNDSYHPVTSGVYLYRIRTMDGEITKKMILLR